jgi:hypothetical protein
VPLDLVGCDIVEGGSTTDMTGAQVDTCGIGAIDPGPDVPWAAVGRGIRLAPFATFHSAILFCIGQGVNMLFKKRIDGVEMGSELTKLFGQQVPHAMFMIDNIASGFTLKQNTYNFMTGSRMSYPLFAFIWMFAVCQVIFFSLKDGNSQKLANGMWLVLDDWCARHGIDEQTKNAIVTQVTQMIAKDSHFTATGYLQDYDGNINRPIMSRQGLSYAVAKILQERCLDKAGLDAEQIQTAVSGIVRDFEESFRLGAHTYKQFKVT